MNLQHKTVIELVGALSKLDGAGESTYKFSAKTRYSLAKNLRILRGKVEDYDKVRVGIVRAVWPNGATPDKKDTAEWDRFSAEWQNFLEATEEIENLMRFQFGELNLDVNPIPVTVLASLGALIIEEGS